MKTFSLIERLEMQFGAIAQNAFNHGNLGIQTAGLTVQRPAAAGNSCSQT